MRLRYCYKRECTLNADTHHGSQLLITYIFNIFLKKWPGICDGCEPAMCSTYNQCQRPIVLADPVPSWSRPLLISRAFDILIITFPQHHQSLFGFSEFNVTFFVKIQANLLSVEFEKDRSRSMRERLINGFAYRNNVPVIFHSHIAMSPGLWIDNVSIIEDIDRKYCHRQS